MCVMDRSRLEQLKEKNKMHIQCKLWEKNVLLQDCLCLMKDTELLESKDDIAAIVHSMCEKFSIGEYRHIDGAHELSMREINFIANQVYCIVWDNADLPVIKCLGDSIVKHLDDLFSMSFDTYIFNENFTEITHCDASNKLWKYSR